MGMWETALELASSGGIGRRICRNNTHSQSRNAMKICGSYPTADRECTLSSKVQILGYTRNPIHLLFSFTIQYMVIDEASNHYILWDKISM